MSNQSGQRTNPVNRAYAQALFEMAEEQGALDQTADEMDQIGELLHSEPGLARLLESPSLSTSSRSGAIERVFKDRVSDTVYRFLQVLNQKGRTNALRGIVQAFSDLIGERRGIVEVDAFVPERLEPSQANEVAQRIGQILGRQVVLHQYVDPELIGGLKLRVGDRMIDGSVATQLHRMRRNLTDRGRQKARQGGELQE